MRALRWSTAGLLVVSLAGCNGDADGPTEGTVPSVARVDVTPAVDTLRALDATLQLAAVARDADGNALPEQVFTWSSSDPDVISVDETGLATARERGTATITAMAEGTMGQAELAVQIPDRLSPGEARAVAERFVAAATLGLDDGLRGVGTASRPAETAASPIEISITFDVTENCALDGAITAAGTLDGTLDGETRSADLELDASAAADDCTFEHDGTTFVVFTEVDAPVVITGAVDVVEGEGSAVLEIAGVVFWEADDGRSDQCEIDLTVIWTSEDGRTVSGSVCGEDVGDATD